MNKMIKTPKQEAEELVKMFRDYSWVSCEDGYEITSNIESAKQCAIIAAKKLMQSTLSKLWYIHNNVEVRDSFYYEHWEEVLKEIENYET